MRQRVQAVLVALGHHPLLRQVAIAAAQQGSLPIYLVGGFLRDALLERPGTLDIDLVAADPPSLAEALQASFTGGVVSLGERFRRVSFPWRGERVQVDLSPLRGRGIIEDLQRRDFTINALALPLGEEPPRLIDAGGGLQDLADGRIRIYDPRAFTEDPLRLLRAVRLAAQMEFAIDEHTAEAIRHRAPLLSHIAPERLREEFFKTLDSSRAGHWLGKMEGLGLLDVLLPETQAMRGCLQGPPHRFDVFTHSLEAVRSVDRIIAALPEFLPQEAPPLVRLLQAEVEGGVSRQALLRFTGLLHDVAKPHTRSAEGGQVRFLGHAERGAGMVQEISRHLRLGHRASSMSMTLVREHFRPLYLRQVKTITPRARYRFFREFGELSADLLLLSLADIHATWGREGRDFRAHLRFVREMFAFHRERMTTAGPQMLLDGHELMARLALSPGPFLGFVLERLREKTAVGHLRTKEAAWQYLERHLNALREEFAAGESP